MGNSSFESTRVEPSRRRWRLRGLDAAFLHGESSRLLRHTLKIVELDGVPTRPDLEAAARWLERRVPLAAARLERTRALRPWLAECGPIDVDHHFERFSLAPHEDLDARVKCIAGRLAGRALPRDRPLWRVTLVDDRSASRSVAIVQVHHALADGGAFGRLFEAAAEGRRPGGDSTEERATQSLARVSRPRALVRSLGSGLRSLAARVWTKWWLPNAARSFGGPNTRFDGVVSGERVVTWMEIDFERLKSAAERFDAGLNDLFLAAVGDACRRAGLVEPGDDRSLVAAMPMKSGDDEREQQWWGNHVSNGFVELADQLPDARERVAAVKASTEAAKRVHRAGGGRGVRRLAELLVPGLVRLYRGIIRATGLGAPVNLITSNVPGPSEPIALGPFAVRRLVSCGPLIECVGLNVTMWSYAGSLSLGVHADGGQLSPDDGERLAVELRNSFSELIEAATPGDEFRESAA